MPTLAGGTRTCVTSSRVVPRTALLRDTRTRDQRMWLR